ncbi:FecR domain-containing protein [Chitinophagaceae bacterium 26-R-25]|nr:FecR domain-containing protein [Chitinophagaceae bacterium 26-R-25]
MSSNPIRLKFLLQKYLAGNCTQQELDEFWLLMSELSENDSVETELADLWNTEAEPDAASNVDWNKLSAKLQHRIDEHKIDYLSVASNDKKRKRLWILTAAASAIICIIFSWWFTGKNSSQLANTKPQHKAPVLQIVNLPDGTVVTLNNGSKLDYAVAFNGKSRDVYLVGEAYFDVAHDAKKPFYVHTGNYSVKVLGTAFNVKAYPGDKAISVTVEKGKVQVEKSNSSKPLGVLSAGDQLIVNEQSVQTKVEKVDVHQVLEWKDDLLVFDDISFEEASVIIGNYFGVELKFKDEALRNSRFTGDFRRSSLDDVLDIICPLTKSKWYKENDKIIWIDVNKEN